MNDTIGSEWMSSVYGWGVCRKTDAASKVYEDDVWRVKGCMKC